jgi:Cu-processing system ATP-binding protein
LHEAAQRRVRGFSKGMRQRLGFAQAMLGSPALLFLDEPTNGLDPEGIREFYAILNAMRSRGVTVILTSHILAEIQERVDRLAIMKSGRIHALGTVQELRENMGLPLCVRVLVDDAGVEQLAARLADLGLPAPVAAGEAWRFTAPRERKLEVMQALAGLPGVRDLSVHEPSLEDVFMGYAA